MGKKLTFNDFLRKAKEKHGNKFDYSNVNFKGVDIKVKIICPEHGEFEQTPTNHFKYDCKLCSATKGGIKNRLSKKEFIKKSNLIHNNKFDYSKIKYEKTTDIIKIICPKHGEFEQKAEYHLSGRGCHKCGRESTIKSNTYILEDLIKIFNKKHKNFYNYTKTIYSGISNSIKVECPEHGEFEIITYEHKIGKKCPECEFEQKRLKSQNNFIKNSSIIFDNFYDYKNVYYINNHTPVKIFCPKHGEFEQKPIFHRKGNGCGKCSNNVKLTTKEFVNRSKIIHNNKYKYDKVKYKNQKIHVIINCPKHGDFLQTPKHHLSGHGCNACSLSSFTSKKEKQWLDIMGVSEENRNIIIRENGNIYNVDGLDKDNKIIYEFYGDYWHGNPNRFKLEEFNLNNGKTFGELYNDTIKREEELKLFGYKVISIWEKDFDKKY